MKLYKYLIVVILIFATFLRLYQLKSYPVSLFADEVDAGYQASVLNKCSSDYFGNKYPFHLHSFADYRAPFYIYSVAIIQKFVPDKELSTRLPAAIFGILTCWALYLLVKKISTSEITAQIALFLSAVSPWLIHYSRSAFEVTGMLFFLILGIYYLLEDKYYQSILFLAFSAYFYSTAKLFVVLIVISAIILNFAKYKKIKLKKIALIALFTLIIGFPYLKDTFQGKAGFRFSYINIFSDPTISTQIDYQRFTDASVASPGQIGVKTSFESKIFHNKITAITNKFIENYLSSFGTDFLFVKGDNNLRHQPGSSYLYPFELFLIIGGLILFRKNKYYNFIVTLLLLAPISFALTRDSFGPHGTRLILLIPFFIIFIATAINALNKKIKIILFFVYLFFVSNFLHNYFVHYPQNSARIWHYGIKEALELSYPLENKYQQISYSNKYEPVLPFFLFYRNYIPQDCDPASHIKDSVLDNKYYFGAIDFNKPNGLLVLPLSEYKENQVKLSNYSVYKTTAKNYTEQEQFVILEPHEN